MPRHLSPSFSTKRCQSSTANAAKLLVACKKNFPDQWALRKPQNTGHYTWAPLENLPLEGVGGTCWLRDACIPELLTVFLPSIVKHGGNDNDCAKAQRAYLVINRTVVTWSGATLDDDETKSRRKRAPEERFKLLSRRDATGTKINLTCRSNRFTILGGFWEKKMILSV